uniref:Uncharacterized protein n=1 Tax=Anguilla anguilla TaxID=7936 RepID=A0A0E9Q802_ANGAN
MLWAGHHHAIMSYGKRLGPRGAPRKKQLEKVR